MHIRWLPEAADDLERVVRYIYDENPEAARRVAQTKKDVLRAREGGRGGDLRRGRRSAL